MRVIKKGNYIRVESDAQFVEAKLKDIIYINYAELPYKGQMGVSEKLGHFIDFEGGEKYPETIDELEIALKSFLGIKDAAKTLGKKGGQKTLKKYGKEEMTEWGKKGGRPSAK